MTAWTVEQINTCTGYGQLNLVIHTVNNYAICKRLRKVKGGIKITDECTIFGSAPTVNVKDILFLDKLNEVHHLSPTSEFIMVVDEAIKKHPDIMEIPSHTKNKFRKISNIKL